jgi:hypothetical protein
MNTHYSIESLPEIAIVSRRRRGSHAASPPVQTCIISLSPRHTVASPLSSVFRGHPTPEKILDKSGRGQLCLGTLSGGSKSQTGSTRKPERAVTMEHFWEILTKPDNLPIVGMLLAVIFCLWVAFRQALKHDKLIEQGKKDEIYSEMIK